MDDRETQRPRGTAAGAGLNVRARTEADLAECVRVLEEVHRADAYPRRWPDDPARWLEPDGLIGAWVAESDGQIVGHIVLVSSDDGVAEITRLFVAPEARHAGIASALVDAACAEAAGRGLDTALEVVDTDRAAIRLYERRGWKRVSSEPWPDAPGGATLLHRYVAPFS